MKVTVSITAYNHKEFIAQAIDSVLMQKTDFSYEILIGEDDSPDGTRKIVQSYGEKYPELIRLFLHDRSNTIYVDGKPTGKWNTINNLRNARGQYIAMLDGDDYWTSPEKLQTQVDFMESHPDCSICFHPVQHLHENGSFSTRRAGRPPIKEISTIEDLLEENFVPKSSVLFRNGLIQEFPDWYYTLLLSDWPLHVLYALHGTIGYIDKAMAVHRVHGGSTWASDHVVERRKNIIRTLETLRANLGPRYGPRLEESIARWHWKVINAFLLEHKYLGGLAYLWSVFWGGQVSRTALARASAWAWRNRSPGQD